MNKIIPLASFGDSYVDRKGPRTDSWHDQLAELRGLDISICHNVAQHGASSWWGVYNFKRLLEQGHIIQNAVFSFTTSCRMPISYDQQGNNLAQVCASYEYNMYCNMTPEERAVFVKEQEQHGKYGEHSYGDVFGVWDTVMENDPGMGGTRHFIKYANKWMICEVHEMCKQYNINATFIIPFGINVEEYLNNRDYILRDNLVITNLDAVSLKEMRVGDGGHCEESDPTHPVKFVRWYEDDWEGRCNHLTGANNKILADLIHQGLCGRTGLVDFSKLDLDYDDIFDYAEFKPNPYYKPYSDSGISS